MSEKERAGQQRRFCGTCGAEVRAGSAFCVSCGTRLVPGPEGEGTPHPDPPSDGRSPLSGTIHETLQRASERLRAASTGLDGTALRRVPERAVMWFKDLPGVPKLAIAGLVLLILVTVLSPLALVAAVLVFGISVVALIVRVAQRGAVLRWGGVAVVSLLLTFTFSVISNALYGGVLGSGGADYRVVHSYMDPGETNILLLSVFSDADDEAGLRAIAESVAESVVNDEKLVDVDVVAVDVLDPDTTVEDPMESFTGVRPKDPEADPWDLDSNGNATINLSADTYYDSLEDNSLPSGYYEVLHSGNGGDCNLVGAQDCNIDEVEEYPIPAW